VPWRPILPIRRSESPIAFWTVQFMGSALVLAAFGSLVYAVFEQFFG
jgi:lipid-A-disaccharide synthase-like uncharacterized protein